MDKDRVKGKVQKIQGKGEQFAGKLTGNSNLKAHGALDQAQGTVRESWGKTKDSARQALNGERNENAGSGRALRP